MNQNYIQCTVGFKRDVVSPGAKTACKYEHVGTCKTTLSH